MKRSDWALIVLIVAIAGVISYFVVSAVMPEPNKEPQTVTTAEPIVSTVATPNDQIFSAEAINPTVKTTIGDQSDKPPFTLGSN